LTVESIWWSSATDRILISDPTVCCTIGIYAACILEKQEACFAITRMKLRARGVVPVIDEETFSGVAKEADKGCPVSN
jgi:organic hydroperoxide reductase OsmC/OhrA